MQKIKIQTYNDGVAHFFEVTTSGPGGLPKKLITPKLQGPLPYEELKVGVTRFYIAKQERTNIERLLRVPRVEKVQRDDVVTLIDGQQYQIKQIQYPPEITPPSMDLSLERVEVAYAVREAE